MYSAEYRSFQHGKTDQRLSKVYVPIDIDKIARKLGTEGDIIFGRLYHHLNKKYGYTTPQGPYAFMFTRELGDGTNKEVNCIHFPLMASVLAELQDQQIKYSWTIWLSIIAIIISTIAIILQTVFPSK